VPEYINLESLLETKSKSISTPNFAVSDATIQTKSIQSNKSREQGLVETPAGTMLPGYDPRIIEKAIKNRKNMVKPLLPQVTA